MNSCVHPAGRPSARPSCVAQTCRLDRGHKLSITFYHTCHAYNTTDSTMALTLVESHQISKKKQKQKKKAPNKPVGFISTHTFG